MAVGFETLIAHGGPGTGPYLMLEALANAFDETGDGRPEVVAMPGDDGAEAILHLGRQAANAGIAGSCTPTYLTTPLKRNLPITYRDLTPLSGLVADTYLLVVGGNHPAASASELFSRPTTVAVAPKGGNTHIQAMLLNQATKSRIQMDFYPDVAGAAAAVRVGRADWTTGVTSDFLTDLEAGDLRLVATFAADADAKEPSSSLRAQGIDVSFPLWRGLIGPPGLDEEAVARWEAGIASAVESPVWSAYLAEARLSPALLGAEEFGDLLEAEASLYEEWTRRLLEDTHA